METFLAILGGILIYLLLRIKKQYFSFSQIITGLPEYINFWGIILRLAIPVIVGFILGIILRQLNYAYGEGLKCGIGLIGSLFVILPVLLNPFLLPKKIIRNKKKKELYLFYIVMILSFSVLGRVGFHIGEVINSGILPTKQGLIDGLWVLILGPIFWRLAKNLITE